MAHSSTVSSKGQITLPKPLRDRHHLGDGEPVLIFDSEEGIIVRHGRGTLRGMLAGRVDSEGFERDLKRVRKEWTL
jgi:AbrB family looped-hinge helix DNA binding protein